MSDARTASDIALQLAARPEGVSNAEFAAESGKASENAGSRLVAMTKAGKLFKAQPHGQRSRWFATQAAADAFVRTGTTPDQHTPTAPAGTTLADVARECVAKLRNDQTRSSEDLAELCKASPGLVDQALAPLVDAKKLVRVSVYRMGKPMFDYRYGAAWKPCDADFNFDAVASVPLASLSPTPAPKPPKAKVVAAPAAPAPAKPKLIGLPVVVQGQPAPPPSTDASFPPLLPEFERELANEAVYAKAMGWQVAEGDESLVPGADDEPSKTLVQSDLVCAINSRGEFVLDLGTSVIQFAPSQALVLKRFLDNTSVLEELAAGGAL